MITEQEYKETGFSLYGWACRRLKEDTLDFYHDTEHEWVVAILYYYDLSVEMYDQFYDKENKRFNINIDQWNTICRRYIQKARENNERSAGEFISTLWNDFRHQLEDEAGIRMNLYDPRSFLRPATEAEKDKYYDLLSNYSELHKERGINRDEMETLTYRDINAIFDPCFFQAILIDENGRKHVFPLDWDWWFNIDQYLDLNVGWKDVEEYLKEHPNDDK